MFPGGRAPDTQQDTTCGHAVPCTAWRGRAKKKGAVAPFLHQHFNLPTDYGVQGSGRLLALTPVPEAVQAHVILPPATVSGVSVAM